MSEQSVKQSILQSNAPAGEPPRRTSLVPRAATAADLVFQRGLYRERRAAELAALPWCESDKQAFCDMQFHLQRAHWAQRFPDARHWILCRDDKGCAGDPVGLVIWERQRFGLHVIDIALHPDWRGVGWGTRILRALRREAAPLPLYLTVEQNSAAVRLYQRLGFEIESRSDPVRIAMVWQPKSVSNRSGVQNAALAFDDVTESSIQSLQTFQDRPPMDPVSDCCAATVGIGESASTLRACSTTQLQSLQE